jgi:hypothetical protein
MLARVRKRPRRSVLERVTAAVLALGIVASSGEARAAGRAARDGLRLARAGDCVAATPLLEEAEAESHRPVTAAALAACRLSLGDLLLAYDLYTALADEAPQRSWTRDDRDAHARADELRDRLEARLPRVSFDVTPRGLDLEGAVAGRKVTNFRRSVRVAPDEPVHVRIAAEGYAPYEASLVLEEGEDRVVRVNLARSRAASEFDTISEEGESSRADDGDGDRDDDDPNADARRPNASGGERPGPRRPTHWLGARYRGMLVPEAVMDVLMEGGRTTYWPGGALTYTADVGDVELVTSLQVMQNFLSSTPVKPKGTPDTEWELIESDIWSGVLALDVLYRIDLDDAGDVGLRLGAGIGLGLIVAGDLRRWQSYPANGKPGDPYAYLKCNAPNDPAGTFRYCNQLDKDATRYGTPDASWFSGGLTPTIYPWLVLPEIGLAIRADDDVSIDFDVGLMPSGILSGVGVRFGL